MSWNKIFLPMWNSFISICNDESGPGQITKNNIALSNMINQQDNIYWRTNKPPKIGQYIVNIGGDGISWGWWDGNNWKKLWHEHQIDVSGWLPTPLYKQQDNG